MLLANSGDIKLDPFHIHEKMNVIYIDIENVLPDRTPPQGDGRHERHGYAYQKNRSRPNPSHKTRPKPNIEPVH
jgi:hypothetical protein